MCFVIVKRNQYPKQGDVRDEDGQVGEIGHPRDPHKSGCKIFSFSNTSIKRKKKSHHATQTSPREGKTPASVTIRFHTGRFRDQQGTYQEVNGAAQRNLRYIK